MNPLSLVTSAVTHPVRTVGSVVALGAQTTVQVIEWAAGQARDLSRARDSGTDTSVTDAPSVRVAPAPASAVDAQVREEAEESAPAVKAPAKKAPTQKMPAKKTAAKKAPAKRAPAKKAPSARAATLGPALGPDALESLEDAEARQTDEPLLDPAVAKSVRSEAEVLSRAADPDKG